MDSSNFSELSNLSAYTSDELAQVASFSAQTGIKMFPVSASETGKRPCCKGWLTEATDDPASLFGKYLGQAARFGIPCKSNQIIVIDCDVKDLEAKGNGVEQFAAYCEKHGQPHSPVWQSTPSGGRHYFYRADFPEIIRGKTKISLDGNPVNIDIRAPGAPDSDGNYVVSDLSGRSGYEWHGDWSQIPPLPQILVEELKERPRSEAPSSEASGEWPDFAEASGEKEGFIGGEVPEHIVEMLERKLAKMAKIPEGSRNNKAYVQACKIRRWLYPYPGAWDKWEPRIVEAVMATGLGAAEAKKVVEQGKNAGEKSGAYPLDRYQEKENYDFSELPRAAFSDALWGLIEAIADRSSSSPEAALASLLTLGAQCLGYNRSIEIENKGDQKSNLWTILIAPSGAGKSTCFGLVTQRLREIQEEMFKQLRRDIQKWEEKRRNAKKNKKSDFDDGEPLGEFPRAVGILVQDTTLEALCEVLGNLPRSVLYYADEMRGFFGSHKRYQSNNIGSANTDPYLAMYDSQTVNIWRKTKDHQNHQISLPRGTLTLLGNIQPGLVKNLFSGDDFEQGWPQRCIFIRAPAPKPLIYPFKKSESRYPVDDAIRRITDRLWEVGSDPGMTTIDKDCEEYLNLYTQSLECDFKEPPLSKLESFSTRFHWTSYRIIHVLFFLEWALSSSRETPKSVTKWHAYKGVLLCRWLISNAVAIFLGEKGGEDSSNDLQKTIAKIVVEHEKDIIAEGYKVPSPVFREWLKEAGFGSQADQFFTKTLNSMDIMGAKARKNLNGESVSIRVKVFSDKAMALCRKLAKPFPMLFSRLDSLESPSELESAPLMPELEALSPEFEDLSSSPSPVETQRQSGTETPPEPSPESRIEVECPEPEADSSALALDYSNPHNFTHLHLHTDASFQDAILSVDQAIRQAKMCNMTSLAITDHGNLHNSRKFYLAARAACVKPVQGCEINLKNDGLFPAPPAGQKAKTSFHLTLLAENQEGWTNLLALQKHSFDNLYYSTPLVTHDFLAAHSRGLIAMSACLGGEIPQAILQGHDPKPLVDWYQKVFGEDSFFLERMENGYPELRSVNQVLSSLSQECGAPIVATSDVHYLAPEDREAYIVNAMRDWQLKNGETIADHAAGTWDLHFRTAAEMGFAHWERTDELELAGKIADRCHVELPDPGKGKFFMPPSETIVGADRNAGDVLEEKTLDGLVSLGFGENPDYFERLAYEIGIITQKGFETYILMISDMIDEARRRGIAVGPGRGSGAGSLVNYALGITQIDPIKNGLLFERFINPDRSSLPDIDVDFDEERRGEILDYLREKYGDDCVAAIGTIGTRKGKTAINDTIRNLQNDRPQDLSEKEWTAIGKQLSSCVPDVGGQTIAELENAGVFAGVESSEAARILRISATLEGLSRQAGQHACGYVVSPHSLAEAIPLRRTAKDGPVTTQWTKDEIEAAGYVKLDALGSLTLTRIRKTLEKIRDAGKPEPSFLLDDKKTFDLFKSGETVGIFQMTSDGMRQLVRKIKPESLQDITVAIALYRPGPLNSGMAEHFLKRRHGKEKVSYLGLDDKLRPILEETGGVIVYQEQVMRIAQAVAGFTAAEADVLRAAMGKKKADVMSEKKVAFIYGALKNGVSKEKAESLFGMMEKFAEYGFNKSHAAAYALVSYHTAYLKANYPAEFLAACCETVDENISPRSIAAECKRLGIDKNSLPTKCDLSGFGEHPLTAYGKKREGEPSVRDLIKGQTATIRVYAESVRETAVKSSGEKMGIGKVSDETGAVSFVAFPETWSAVKIKKGRCYDLSGDIKMGRDKVLQLVVKEVIELSLRTA